jgi:hypothetical protein
MTRRIVVCLAAVVGAVLLLTSASAASAQVGFPSTIDFAALFESILASLPAFLQGFIRALFESILSGFCAVFGTCAS